MTERDFDKCPECGAFPVFGLRCHPKFSLKVGMRVDGELDLVALYAHDEPTIRALRDVLANDGFSDVIAMDRWDADEKKWVEFH